MGTRSIGWAERRGLGRAYSETTAPWARLRASLEARYRLGIDLERPWEAPDDEDVRNVPVLLRLASAAIDDDLARIARTHGPPLSPTEVDALRRIAAKPSAIVQLAEHLRLSPTRTSRVVSRLVEHGLVTCESPFSDLRQRRSRVTPEGEELVAAIEHDLDDLARLWLDDLDPAVQATAVRFLGSLAALT
jgi:DNA-binding MarR family transcriptional regulator